MHEQMLQNPSTDRMRDVHMLHLTQSLPMLDETSALHGNMPQHNNKEGGKQPRLSFSPAVSMWGQMGRAWTTVGRSAPRTTEAITETDYVAFFHQFFGLTNNPALAPFANVPCPCQRYFMGGEGAWYHINSCLQHASNWTCAHDHVLRALDRMCNDAGFATTHKRVLTSEGNLLADLAIHNIRVAGQTNSLVDVTVRHNFKGTGHNGQTQDQLRNPDNPDHILESAATNKIRNYRDTYHRNRHVAFLPPCMSTSGRIHGELLRLIFFISSKQAEDYFETLSWVSAAQPGFLSPSRRLLPAKPGTIGMVCAQAVALRGALPPQRVATSLPLAVRRGDARWWERHELRPST